MNDQGNNNGDFADEPTDPGIRAPSGAGQGQQAQQGQQAPQSDAVNSLGFRPQTGAFGAVGGPQNAPSPQQQPSSGQHTFSPGQPGQQPQQPQVGNPFRGQQDAPQSGAHQGGSQPNIPQGPASGSFAPPMANPTGSFNVSTGEFSAPNAGGPQSGAFSSNPQSGSFQTGNGPGSGSFGAPAQQGGQQNAPPSGSFAPPMTGGFQAVQGQNPAQAGQPGSPTGQMQGVAGPGQGQPNFATGPMPGVGQNAPGAPGQQNTGSFQAPGGNQPLQIGDYVEEPPEPTVKVRALFGVGGFLFGAIVGLALGLLNSLFEGVGILAGMGITLQIALWFGGMIGLIAAWKPDKVWETLEGYGFFD